MTTPQANAQRKAELLSTTVEHIDITSFDARPIVDAMGKMSFTSRDLARATRIYNQMLEDPDCTIFLVIAGSTSAGGCMDLYAELLRSNMIDGIVATGASIVDMDFFEGLGHKHYQALEVPDDDTLRSLLIDRIYDTYIDEEQLQDCDHTIYEIANALEPRPYSSRAFIREMGKYLVTHGKKDNSLVKLAYEHDVPIFCPAFVDSSAGFGLVKHQVDCAKAGKPYMVLDAIADFRELTDIKIKAGTTGLLMIGAACRKTSFRIPWSAPKFSVMTMCRYTNTRCRSPLPMCVMARVLLQRCKKRRAGARSTRVSNRWCLPKLDRSCRCSRRTLITVAGGRRALSANGARFSTEVVITRHRFEKR